MTNNLNMTEAFVRIKGPLYLVVEPNRHSHLLGHLGTVYGDKDSALSARDPGEIIVELRLATEEMVLSDEYEEKPRFSGWARDHRTTAMFEREGHYLTKIRELQELLLRLFNVVCIRDPEIISGNDNEMGNLIRAAIKR